MKTLTIPKIGVTQNLDVFLALLGFIAGILAIILSEIFQLNRTYLGVVVILGSLVFLFYRQAFIRNKQITSRGSPGFLVAKVIPFVSIFIFAALLAAGTFYHKLLSLYYRDPLYFIFVLCAVLTTYLQITLLDVRPFWVQVILLIQILLLGISIRASAFYLYPSLSGNDPFYHQYFVERLIAYEKFPIGELYSSFPLFHTIIGVFSLLGISNIKDGFFYISILHCLSLLAVFPLAKAYLNIRIGLLASLLLILSDYQIQWGVQIIPMTLATGLYVLMLVLFLMIKKPIRNYLSGTIFLFLLGLSMIFTHTLSTLILIISLICLWLIPVLLRTIKINVDSTVRLTFILFLLIGSITYWGGYTEPQETNFFTRVVMNIRYSLTESRLGDTSVISHASEMNPLDVILLDAGWGALLFFFVIGFLGAFTVKPRKQEILYLGVLAVFLIFVTYVSALFGTKELLPARWFTFAYFPVAILAGFSISRVVSSSLFMIFRERNLLSVFPLLMIFASGFASIFLMVTSPARAMPDSPFYLTDLVEKPGFYQSEITGMNYAMEKFPASQIAAGSKTKRHIHNALPIDPEAFDSYSSADVIVLRQTDFEKGLYIPYPKDQVNKYSPLTNEFLGYLHSNFYLIYDNGSTKIFGKID